MSERWVAFSGNIAYEEVIYEQLSFKIRKFVQLECEPFGVEEPLVCLLTLLSSTMWVSESTESLPWALSLSKLLCFLISSGFTLSTSLFSFNSNEVIAMENLGGSQHHGVVQFVPLLMLSPKANTSSRQILFSTVSERLLILKLS